MSVTRARSRLNALQRYRTADDPDVLDARRDLAVESIEQHVRRVIAAAPTLTAEQIARIRSLLPPASEKEAADA